MEEEVEEGYGSCIMEDRLPHHSWDWRSQTQILARLGTQITSLSSAQPGETTVSQVWFLVCQSSQYSLGLITTARDFQFQPLARYNSPPSLLPPS